MNTTDSITSAASSRPGFARGVIHLLLTAAAVLIAITSIVMVDETEYAIVERLGHIHAVYDRPEDRGLHFKLPWPIDSVRRFDRRLQLFDPPGREVFTRDRKNITVDAFVCWKISEPNSESPGNVNAGDTKADVSPDERPVVRFFRALGNRDIAEARIDSRVRSILNTQIGQVEFSSLFGITQSEAGPSPGGDAMFDELSQRIRLQVEQRADESESLTERLGIELVDVRIKRINFPLGNQQAVFDRMKSERRKIADRYRSAGMAENRRIRSRADRQYNEILSRARGQAERIRGTAEAEAVGLMNAAHARDPEFYRLLRTLDAYREIVNENTTLVLSAKSNLFKLLTDGVNDSSDHGAGVTELDGPSAGMANTSRTDAGDAKDLP